MPRQFAKSALMIPTNFAFTKSVLKYFNGIINYANLFCQVFGFFQELFDTHYRVWAKSFCNIKVFNEFRTQTNSTEFCRFIFLLVCMQWIMYTFEWVQSQIACNLNHKVWMAEWQISLKNHIGSNVSWVSVCKYTHICAAFVAYRTWPIAIEIVRRIFYFYLWNRPQRCNSRRFHFWTFHFVSSSIYIHLRHLNVNEFIGFEFEYK